MFALWIASLVTAFATVPPSSQDVVLPDLPGVDAADPPGPSAIVNGETESGFPQTVSLGAMGFSMCTGSVITPRLVLTAGHCGDGLPIDVVLQFGEIYIGDTAGSPDHKLAIQDLVLHPNLSLSMTQGGGLTSLPEYDIAMVHLEEDAPVDPIWVVEKPIKKWVEGEKVTSVGFGLTSANSQASGVKYSAKMTIDAFDDQFVYSNSSTNPNGSQICSGDSGGPQYWKDPDTGEWLQLAVHSWGDTGCIFESGSTRVDLVMDFIMEQVEDAHGTTDMCEIYTRYGDGVCDADCELFDPDCMQLAGFAERTEYEDVGGCQTAPGPQSALWMVPLLVVGLRRRASA